MKKLNTLLLLLLCFGIRLYGQNPDPLKHIHALEKRLARVDDTAQVNTLNELSRYYNDLNAQKALTTAQRALEMAQNLSYHQGIITSLTHIGNAYRELEKPSQSLTYYNQALGLAVKIRNIPEQAQAFKNIGHVHYMQSEYAPALNHLSKAFTLASKLKNKTLMGESLMNIGLIYYDQSIYPKALTHFLQAARFAEQAKAKNILLRSTLGVGYIYNEIEEYDKALTYFQKAFQLKKQVSNSPSIGIMHNLGNVYYGKGDYKKALGYYQTAYQNSLKLKSGIGISNTSIGLGAAYFKLKNYTQALHFYTKALQSSPSPILESLAQIGLSNTSRELGNYEKAIAYAQKGLQTASRSGIKKQMQRAYLSLSETYAAKGDTNKAYSYHLKHIRLKDSIYNTENTYRIAILQSNLALEKKQAVIQLQQEIINQQSRTKFFLIVGMSIILILGMFLYKENRKKHQANLALNARNREINRVSNSLKRAQQKLRSALSLGLVGTWVYNVKRNKIFLDEGSARMFDLPTSIGGIRPEDFTKKIMPEDQMHEEEIRKNAILYNNEYQVEYRVKHRRGKIVWIFSRGKAEYDSKGQLTSLSGVMVDITEKKEIERHKDEFLSIASHELKTPLASLKGYLQLVEHTLEKTHRSYNFASKSSKQLIRLERLTSDLIDVTQISQGKLHYTITEFDFGDMLKEVVESLQLVVNHNIIIEEIVSIKYIADRYRIEQVINNFLNNAIKYSPNAEKVAIRLSTDKNNLVVAIQDFGIGIESQHLQRLHERFYRVSSSLKKFEGLGLGLYISAEILKHHKGRFWVESEPGEGSTFYFSLPLLKKKYNKTHTNTRNKKEVTDA